VLGTGSDTLPVWPQMPGRNKFKGAVIHGQNYREYAAPSAPRLPSPSSTRLLPRYLC
jgi:hypothetical protein